MSDSDPPDGEDSDETASDQNSDLEPQPGDVATTDSSGETSEQDGDEAEAATLSATAQSLKALADDHLGVFLAEKTFEWDLVKAGNWDVLLKSFERVKPHVSKRLRRAHVTSSWDQRADAFLAKVEDKKGRFAQELAADAGSAADFIVPKHIEQAVFWTTIAPAPRDDRDRELDIDADPTAK